MNELGEHGLEAIELATSKLTGSVKETAVRNETAARNETGVRNETAARNETVVRNGTRVRNETVVRNGTRVRNETTARNETTEPPTFPSPTVSPTDGMPSFEVIDERMRELMQTQEVAKTAEYKIVSQCMRQENQHTLAVVQQGLQLFRASLDKKERGKTFRVMAEEVVTTITNLIELARSSGAFSGYENVVTNKEMAVAVEAKSLHLNRAAVIISQSIGSGSASRRLAQLEPSTSTAGGV